MNTEANQDNLAQALLAQLDEGRRSGEQEGWMDAEEVFKELAERYSR